MSTSIDFVEADSAGDGFHGRVKAFRKRILQEALSAADGNRTKAAEALGLQRTYFMRLIRKHPRRERVGR